MKASLRFDEVLSAVPEATAELLVLTARIAIDTGHDLHLVGGPVRDLLLGRPLADVDILIERDASGLASAVQQALGKDNLSIVEYSRFATLRIETREARLDLANLRHETYAHPGALPDVVPGNFQQDCLRRDFSINAMSWKIDAENPGKSRPIVDECRGLQDLAAHRLRVLHSRSFHDDPTRAWRAARFAARLGFSLDRGSRSVLRDALRDGAFGAVSGERFRRELILAFDEASLGTHPGRVLRLLADWHVLGAIEPGLGLDRDRMAPLRRLGRAIENPEWSTRNWRPWVAGLSIWLAPMPAALRRRALERFSIRGDQATRICRFGRDADRILRGLAKARGRGAVDAALGDLSEDVVQGLYSLAPTAVRRRMLRWGAEDRKRRSPVTGADLTEIGLSGPDTGRALARIRSGFLDGEIANREEALVLAEEIALRAASRRPTRPKTKTRKESASNRATHRKSKIKPSRPRRVAAERPIADTPDDRRRTTAIPGNASPQADPSR